MDAQTDAAALADMLGQVREEIKALKDREAELRARILSRRANAPLEGAHFTVSVRRSTRRSFNAKALPPEIREDPRYWTETESQTVLVKPRQKAEEDIQLIE